MLLIVMFSRLSRARGVQLCRETRMHKCVWVSESERAALKVAANRFRLDIMHSVATLLTFRLPYTDSPSVSTYFYMYCRHKQFSLWVQVLPRMQLIVVALWEVRGCHVWEIRGVSCLRNKGCLMSIPGMCQFQIF